MKKLDLYREFQKNIMTVVQSEALMCGFKEYSVSIRNQSTEVKIYVQQYTATLSFYYSGRTIVKYTVSKNEHDEIVLIDKVDRLYTSGKCSVADLVSKYVYEVFDVALEMRQRRRMDFRKRHMERSNPEYIRLIQEDKTSKESLDTIGNQQHTRYMNDEIKKVFEEKEINVTDDSYLSEYDEIF